MKRSDAVSKLVDFIDRKTDLNGRVTASELITFMEEEIGMIPPETRFLTPAGAFMTLEVNEWEEYANYNEAGYIMGEGPFAGLSRAKVVK